MNKHLGFINFCLLLGVTLLSLSACRTDLSDKIESADVAVEKTESWWQERHSQILNSDFSKAEILFLGDSITQKWEEPVFGFSIWQQYYGENAVNLGFGGDKTQNLLWRITNGEIDHMSPEVTILLIGTNNAQDYSPEDIAKGINAIVAVIKEKLPETRLIVHRIFPRGDVNEPLRKVTDAASELIAQRTDVSDPDFTYVDINGSFLDSEGNVFVELMPDGVHLSTEGYAIWANEIAYYLSL